VTASLVCEKLFPGRPESVGKAVVNRCQELDLLDGAGNLTSLGEEALRTGVVFVPERGKYLIWYSEDPLLLQNLLHLEPLDEDTINDELAVMRRSKGSSAGSSSSNPIETPVNLLSLKGKTFDLWGKGGGTIFVKEVEDRCMKRQLAPEDQLQVSLSISESSGCKLRIDGKFNRTLTPPTIEFGEALLDVLGPLGEMWDSRRDPHSLRCRFIDLGERELNTFRKDLSVTKPALRKFGKFKDAVLKDVPIRAATLTDAENWAQWLLRRSVSTYLSKDRYDEKVREAVNKFPDFSSRIKLPKQKDLAQQIRGQSEPGALPEEYWYLQAPLDLVESMAQS
jgi:hypothetical protein